MVTHSADTVRSICDRGVVLSHGLLVAEGEPGEATRIFRERLMAEGAGMAIIDPALVAVPAKPDTIGNDSLPDTERPVRFRSVHRIYSGDNTVPYMRTGDDLIIRVEFEALYATEDVVFSLEIRDDHGNTLMRTDTSIIGMPIDAPRGISVMHFGIVDMPMLDGSFNFALGIQSRSGILYDWQEHAGTFEVMNPGKTTGAIHLKVHAALDLERERRRILGRAGPALLREASAMNDSEVPLPEDPQAYVAQVMAEIAEEVRLRRASGDLPPKLERELDELFLAHSPVAGRGGDLSERAPHGRRGHVHRSGRAGRIREGGGCLRQEGHALDAPLVRRVGHPPDEPVGVGREPRTAHRGPARR